MSKYVKSACLLLASSVLCDATSVAAAAAAAMSSFRRNKMKPDVVPDDCVFEGHWRFKNGLGKDLIVQMTKVSDEHPAAWNLTVVDGFARHSTNVTDGLDDPLPPTQMMSVSHHGASPCLCTDEDTGKPLCRDDSVLPRVGLMHGSLPDLGDFWLGRVAPAPAPESIHWHLPSDHEGRHCPLANVNELIGQQTGSAGCRGLTATRVHVEDAPVDEGGYMMLAEEHSVYVMKHYMHRVVKHLGWSIDDDGGLAGFAPWYCGVRVCDGKKCYRPPARQSLQKMMFELADAKWVKQLGTDNPRRMVALLVLQLHWFTLFFLVIVMLLCLVHRTFEKPLFEH